MVRTLKVGGMERVAVNLADAFAAQGHESHLMYFKARPPQLAPQHAGVHVHHFSLARAMWKSGIGGGVEIAARLGNAIVRKSHFLIAGWWAGHLFQRKVKRLERYYGNFDRIIFRGMGTFEAIWSFHDPRGCYVLENILNLSQHKDNLAKFKARCLFHDKHLISVSTGVERQVSATLKELDVAPGSLHTITNPCPIADIRQAAQAESTASTYPPYLLNVARLVPQKNHHLLLQTYALMRTSLPLVLVGDGPLREELEALTVELNIADRVYFVGQQLNPYPWMKHAQLFILSSRHEGLGIVLLEALACGTPVVSVDCPGGVRDIMRGKLAEYLCEMTPDALAARVDTTLESGGYVIDERWLDAFSPPQITAKFLQEPTDS